VIVLYLYALVLKFLFMDYSGLLSKFEIRDVFLALSSNILFILGVFIGAIILHLILSQLIQSVIKLFRASNPYSNALLEKRTLTVGLIVSNVLRVVIYTVAIVVILPILGVDVLPVIAGAGVLGLAIGFGSQTLVKDFVTGLIVLVENHMNVGDRVEIDGEAGIVKALQLRVTILEDDKGNEIIIPNNKIDKIKVLKNQGYNNEFRNDINN